MGYNVTDIKELRQQRVALVEEARAIINKEDVSDEDTAKFDELMAEADRLKERIDRMERAEREAAELLALAERKAEERGVSVQKVVDEQLHEMEVFGKYVRCGMQALSDQERSFMEARYIQAAQGVGTDSAGGYLVPEEFRRQLIEAMLAYGGMRLAANVFTTDSGANMLIPTTNDTTNKGAILNENTQVSEQDVTFGQVQLPVYMYTSKLVRVSFQLLQDSAFDLNAFLARALGTRLARATNEHYTTGTGSGQPNGIVTAATAGVTAASATDIDFTELVELEHSVDPSYRRNAIFMFHDAVLRELKKKKDAQNRPLWVPGYAVGEPDRIIGYRYVINQDMADTIEASAKTVLFGDFSYYWIRDAMGVRMMRLTERYADYLQVGFLAYMRTGATLVDAGTHPVKYLQQAAL